MTGLTRLLSDGLLRFLHSCPSTWDILLDKLLQRKFLTLSDLLVGIDFQGFSLGHTKLVLYFLNPGTQHKSSQ